jgi:hypothetical protein
VKYNLPDPISNTNPNVNTIKKIIAIVNPYTETLYNVTPMDTLVKLLDRILKIKYLLNSIEY